MPTTDERREVAARLRKKHGERQGTFEPQSMSIQAMNRLDDLLDCLPKRRDMFLDLADLIEPEPERTCRIVDETGTTYPHKAGENEEFWGPAGECSECGAFIPIWGYCPNCGAKVME